MNDFIELISEKFKDIFFIHGERKGQYPYSNALLIGDYLIDTGISSKYIRKLKKDFEINNVINSHWHEDHISGNRLLTGAKFFCHELDKPIIEDINKMIVYYGVKNTPAEKLLDPIIEGFRMENTQMEKTFEHNELIKIDDYDLRVIHTPGHTAGHCSFYEENSSICFLGDIDLTRFIYYGTIDSNLTDFVNSIENLKKFDIKIAISGHRGMIIGKAKINEELNSYKELIYKNEQHILSNLSESKPMNVQDLLNKNLIYKFYSEFKAFEVITEKVMIEKHFEKLLKNNQIEKKNKGYILK
jgi:glyoxylase-like metal-dependent hydrolase (beta-lactamase superfamily II)